MQRDTNSGRSYFGTVANIIQDARGPLRACPPDVEVRLQVKARGVFFCPLWLLLRLRDGIWVWVRDGVWLRQARQLRLSANTAEVGEGNRPKYSLPCSEQ